MNTFTSKTKSTMSPDHDVEVTQKHPSAQKQNMAQRQSQSTDHNSNHVTHPTRLIGLKEFRRGLERKKKSLF